MWGQIQASPGVIKTGGKHNTAKCILFNFVVASVKRVNIFREVSERGGEWKIKQQGKEETETQQALFSSWWKI